MLEDYRLDLRNAGAKKLSWADRECGFLDYNSDGRNLHLYTRADSIRVQNLTLKTGSVFADKLVACCCSAIPGEIQLTEEKADGSSFKVNFGLLMEQAVFFVELSATGFNATGRDDMPQPVVQLEFPFRLQPEQVIDQTASSASLIWLSPQAKEGTSAWMAFFCTKPPSDSKGAEPVFKIRGRKLCLSRGHGSQESLQVFFCWAETRDAVLQRAKQLTTLDLLGMHHEKVLAYLKHAAFRTGNRHYDTALAWAAFSGWSLVANDYGPGIWAGLPWFRDNWGRDTFIALPGILLVSGRYAEAREVIGNFATRQDCNPASPNYGRIPNRWRSPTDIIFNTVDGTLWFIREIWDYYAYTGDRTFLLELWPAVCCAIQADLTLRCDDKGFLCHGASETWMDARIDGKEPWSDRGNRAVEVQALWYTALNLGSRIADVLGSEAMDFLGVAAGDLALTWRQTAEGLSRAFRERFVQEENGILADRLLPDNGTNDGLADVRLRPNAVLALTIPLPEAMTALGLEIKELLATDLAKRIVEKLCGRLLFAHGMCSLHQHDPFFHPAHEQPKWYHKDAAYHNGTIWGWNTGFTVSALCRHGFSSAAYAQSDAQVQQLLHGRCPGSLSENLHAYPDTQGCVVESGTWSQAWSVSEFVRNAWQDYLGFRPMVADGVLQVQPRLPADWTDLSVETLFGTMFTLSIRAVRQADDSWVWEWRCSLNTAGQTPAEPLPGQAEKPGICIKFGDHQDRGLSPTELRLEAGAVLVFLVSASGELRRLDSAAFGCPSVIAEKPGSVQVLPTEHGLAFKRLQERNQTLGGQLVGARPVPLPWLQTIREKDYLKRIIMQGKYDAGYGSWLDRLFNSPGFADNKPLDYWLGAQVQAQFCRFRVWAPLSTVVWLRLYEAAEAKTPSQQLALMPAEQGFWQLEIAGDWRGWYYTYALETGGLVRETIDPYAKACSVNGVRGALVELAACNPDGWTDFMPPALSAANDAIVYELHVRDISSRESWHGDPALRGTYKACIEAGLHYAEAGHDSIPVGFDHIRSLGVSHVQVLPVFDFVSVDENRTNDPDYCRAAQNGIFNWGYDPGNYNVPEGSYATKPQDPMCRIRELKELIMACGRAGLGVVMDVVYNHVPEAAASCLDVCVPGYYFRLDCFSGAGSDTASERMMFRKYMIDSLCYWLSEYKLSGFRFDLMGLHDLQTMQAVETALRRIKPDVLLYGEGWDMYRADQRPMASMLNIHKFDQLGMFNDAFRCGLKGLVFEAGSTGWLQDGSRVEDVAFGLVGAVRHHGVANTKVGGTARPRPWTEASAASVNYTEIHDNLTLYDKLCLSLPDADEAALEAMQRIALGLILLAQGMPVIHAGMEFLRTKEVPAAWLAAGGIDKCIVHPDGVRQFCHDSYKAGDVLNGLDWQRASRYRETVAWLRVLCALRREHPAFRLRDGKTIRRSLKFLRKDASVLAWRLVGCNCGDRYTALLVAVNRSTEPQTLRLPKTGYCLLANSCHPEADYTAAKPGGRQLELPPRSLLVLGLKD